MSDSDREKFFAEPNRQQPVEGYAEEEIAIKIKSLEFDVNKSIRYLTKRKSFLRTLHHISMILTAISSSAAFAVLFTNYQTSAKIFTFLAAIIAWTNSSIGFPKKSELYDNLQRRFSDLLIKITSEPSTMENLKKWKTERFLIEKDEPTTLKVLEVICHK
jgi:hypothetical protein